MISLPESCRCYCSVSTQKERVIWIGIPIEHDAAIQNKIYESKQLQMTVKINDFLDILQHMATPKNLRMVAKMFLTEDLGRHHIKENS